jgi:hypothetical protein
MTDRCWECSKFISESSYDGLCDRCIELLGAEATEAETGIGTGSCYSGKFGTDEYCRHVIKRSTNVPKGRLRLLT